MPSTPHCPTSQLAGSDGGRGECGDASRGCMTRALCEVGRPSNSPGSGCRRYVPTRERPRRFLIRAMSRTHGGVYRASGGRLRGRDAGAPRDDDGRGSAQTPHSRASEMGTAKVITRRAGHASRPCSHELPTLSLETRLPDYRADESAGTQRWRSSVAGSPLVPGHLRSAYLRMRLTVEVHGEWLSADAAVERLSPPLTIITATNPWIDRLPKPAKAQGVWHSERPSPIEGSYPVNAGRILGRRRVEVSWLGCRRPPAKSRAKAGTPAREGRHLPSDQRQDSSARL